MPPAFFESMLDLITRTSTDLPPDVRAAMRSAMGREEGTSRAGQALTIIALSIRSLLRAGRGAYWAPVTNTNSAMKARLMK